MKKSIKLLSVILALTFIAACFTGCGAGSTDAIIKPLEGDSFHFDDSNGVSVHDPSLFKAQDGSYYVTGSHIAMAKSNDLINWNTVSSGVFDSNRILTADGKSLRESYTKAFAWCDGAQRLWEKNEDEWETNIWASDIFYNKAMGKYCYYACSSVWGTTASVIWFAVSDNPEGTYEFVDCMIYSGFSKRETVFGKPKNQLHYTFTNINDLIENGTFSKEEVENKDWFDANGNYDCTYGKYPNAIDPAPFYDSEGKLWLAYGSFSGGIYVMPLIEETGMPDYQYMKNTDGYDIYFGKQITKTNEKTQGTGEGPYIAYDKESGYYYLFLTYGGLGALDGYAIREYRSENPDGPYVDIAGKDALEMSSTGTSINGNVKFSFDNTALLSGGHSSCLVDGNGEVYQAYHQRYNDGEGAFHNVQIHKMLRTKGGWLTMLPLAYNGETEKAVSYSDIAGTYELAIFDNSQIKKAESWDRINDIIANTLTAEIDEDGHLKVTSSSGADDYYKDDNNTYYLDVNKNGLIKLDNNTYTFALDTEDIRWQGAFCIGTKPDGTQTMTFSALGSNGECMWAVKK